MLDKTIFQSLLTPPIWQQVFASPRVGLPGLGSGPIGGKAGAAVAAPGPYLFDRIKESCTAPGVGNVSLLGSPQSFLPFSTIGNGNSTYYCIQDQSGPNWEVGLGVYNQQANQLLRPDGVTTFPISSSNTTTGSITAASNTTPIQITSAGHGLLTGQFLNITGVVGNAAANTGWQITVLDANNFTLNGSVGSGLYVSRGIWIAYKLTNFASGTQDIFGDLPAEMFPDPATPGSILFVGPSGFYSQDPTNFFYDVSTHSIVLGPSKPRFANLAMQKTQSVNTLANYFYYGQVIYDGSAVGLNDWNSFFNQCNYTSSDITQPTVVTYVGFQNRVNYGDATHAANGTPIVFHGSIIITNCGNFEDECAVYYALERYDSNNNSFGNTTPGRGWVMDMTQHGAIEMQQGALGGVHMVMNNYFHGPPRDNPSGAYWSVTGPAFGGGPDYYHTNARTYQVGTGFGVVGSGNSSNTRGWEVGFQAGGIGSNWGVLHSHLGTGVDITDYDTQGIHLAGQFTGVIAVYVTNGGSGYTLPPTPTFTAPGGGGAITAGGVCEMAPTTIASITVVNAGANFTAVPAVTLSPPFNLAAGATPGTQATATAVMGIGQLVLGSGGSGYTNGTGYALGWVGGGGSGFTGTFDVVSNAVTNLVITAAGTGFTSPPTLSFPGAGGGTGAGGAAFLSIISITVVNAGAGYTILPAVTIAGGGLLGLLNITAAGGAITAVSIARGGGSYPTSATFSVGVLAGNNDAVLQVSTVSASSTGSLTTVVKILNGGTGYTTANGVAVISGGGASATSVMAATTVAYIKMTEQGKKYTTPPTITFTGGGGGSGATAVATTLQSGVLLDAYMNETGSGYVSNTPPVVTITGGQGANCTLNTTTTANVITSATVTAGGTNYPPSTPVYLKVTGGNGDAIVSVTSTSAGVLSGTVTILNGGTGYSNNAANATSNYKTAVIAPTITVASKCVNLMVTEPGSGYNTNPTITIAAPVQTTAIGNAIVNNGAVTGITVTNQGAGYTSNPTITFGAVAGASGAIATSQQQLGQVTNTIIQSGGVGYTSAPTVTFSAPPAGVTATTGTIISSLNNYGLLVESDAGITRLQTQLQMSGGTITNTYELVVSIPQKIGVGALGIVQVQNNVTPTANLGTFNGLLFLPKILDSGGSSFNITSLNNVLARVDTGGAYAGTITNINTFYVQQSVLVTGTVISNTYCFRSDNINYGATNHGLWLDGNMLNYVGGMFGFDITPTFGIHALGGSMRIQALATPGAPTLATGGGTPAGASDFYCIVAEDRAGNKTLASAASAQTTRGSSAANWVKVTWSAVAGAVKYYVLVNTVAAPASTTVMTLTGTWTAGSITGISALVGGSGGTAGTFTDGTLTNGSGSGATFAYTIAGGAVTNIAILNGGSGYLTQPTFTLPSAGSLVGFSATANIAVWSQAGGTNLEADDTGQAINGAFTLPTRNATADATIDGQITVNAAPSLVPGIMGTETSSVSSTLTAQTVTLVGTLTGTYTCPANFMVVGRKLRLRKKGVITTGATAGTITFFTKFAGTTIASTGAVAPTVSQSNMYWEMETDITCRTTGSSGTFFVQGKIFMMNAATPSAGVTWPIRGNSADPPAVVTVDTTASSLVDFQVTTSNALHTITSNTGDLEVMN